MKKAIPNSVEHISARAELGCYKKVIVNVDSKISMLRECTVLNCSKHLPNENTEVRNETNASSCADMDHTALEDDKVQATTENMNVEFQLVSPRKAAKHPSPVKTTSPIKVGNRFQSLTGIPAPEETRSSPATIKLKTKDTYKTLLKKIAENFPGTENKLLYGYINIKATSEENRLKIIQLFIERKEEFILLEASEDSLIKVALKGLHAETNTTYIAEDLSKGFTDTRMSQKRNYKLKKLL
ncbi:hypothetical protein AVEN_206203-1 [Araneus ventricosus]|uniref:Uncharacterized protein n=1 Tax=Araneus ventricosus TaxID=182803 RepID=A0A4Y2L9U7_ARAVE|nr:hypothetical protein AVEN_206203-1 [Araneus ventricosus]